MGEKNEKPKSRRKKKENRKRKKIRRKREEKRIKSSACRCITVAQTLHDIFIFSSLHRKRLKAMKGAGARSSQQGA